MSRNPQDRRSFLEVTGRTMAGAVLLPVAGGLRLPAEARRSTPRRPGNSPVLVGVFLRGGADALNIVAPYSNDTYYEVRPTIAIPRGDGQGSGVIPLDEHHGLHPALAPLKPLWDRGMLVPVLNAGSPHPTRSHFDAQDFMEYAAPGDRTVTQGWLNRYLQATSTSKDSDLRGLALQQLLPRALRGPQPVLAVPRLRRSSSEGLLDLFDDVYREGRGLGATMRGSKEEREGRPTPSQEVVHVGRSTIEVLREFWDILEKTPGPRKGVRYPGGGFARRLETLARVIRSGSGLEVACLDVSSWDHHQGEGSTDGLIQRRLEVLAGGLAAFFEDLGEELAAGVTVLVMTEFGRNVAENGNRGTDHGHGGLILALGGGLEGRRVVGSYGSLEPRRLYQGRDLPVDVDFREVFTDVLEGRFGFKPPEDFFPNWERRKRIGLMKRA